MSRSSSSRDPQEQYHQQQQQQQQQQYYLSAAMAAEQQRVQQVQQHRVQQVQQHRVQQQQQQLHHQQSMAFTLSPFLGMHHPAAVAAQRHPAAVAAQHHPAAVAAQHHPVAVAAQHHPSTSVVPSIAGSHGGGGGPSAHEHRNQLAQSTISSSSLSSPATHPSSIVPSSPFLGMHHSAAVAAHHHQQRLQQEQQQLQLLQQHHHNQQQQRDQQFQLHFMSALHGGHHPSDQLIQSKRPRLYQVESKTSLSQPLTIDTRDMNEVKKSTYTPQVEAISPTLPDEELRQDLSPFKSTKDELLNNINRIEREISQTESRIAQLKRKQLELEAKSTGSNSDSTNADSTDSRVQQLSIAQLVYSENRSKAMKSHSILDHLTPVPLRPNLGLIPLYNQPSDTVIYHENLAKFKKIKTKLVEMLRQKLDKKLAREIYLTKTYDNLMKEWLKKLESKSNESKSKAKDNKMREFFEKQFPELKKAREDKERLSRAGQRIGARSEADIEDIMDGIQEAELEDKKMRSYAVIPPIIHDCRHKKYLFINTNGRIEDPLSEHKERSLVANVWTDEEKETFREKYILYPKNFGLISTYLERKSVCDCVQYYYLSKKSENYRHLLRKHAKKRTRALVKAQAAAATAASATVTNSSVARTSGRGKGNNNNSNNNSNNNASSSTVNTTGDSSVNVTDDQMDTSTPATAATTSSVTTSVMTVQDVNDTGSNPRLLVPGFDTSGNRTNICCLCKSSIVNVAKSRIVNKSNCHLYGLRSDDPLFDNFENTPPNQSSTSNDRMSLSSAAAVDTSSDTSIFHRICAECRSKHVRRHCPVPTCKTADGKDKRLKALPQQWFELPEGIRTKYSADLGNFPLDITKACLRCVMRVSRRIGAVSPKTVMKVLTGGKNNRRNSMAAQGGDGINNNGLWTEEEMKQFESSFKQHKKNWSLISNCIKNKSINDCKRFYYNFKYKLNLKNVLDTSDGSSSEDSDEYWKGFTDDSEETSSADEGKNSNASDTASASSPPTGTIRPLLNVSSVSTTADLNRLGSLSASQGSLRSMDGNDSNATLSADETDPNLRAISPATRATTSGTTITITPLSIAHATIDRHYRNMPPIVTSGATTLPEGFMSRSTGSGCRPSVISTSSSATSEGLGLSRNNQPEGLMARGQSEGLMSQRVVVPAMAQKFPSFLINPNAPTTAGNRINLSSSNRSTNSLAHSPITGTSNSINSVNATGGSKEEPTCVRDLIYQAIEMSLQTPAKPGSTAGGNGNGPPPSGRHTNVHIPGITSYGHSDMIVQGNGSIPGMVGSLSNSHSSTSSSLPPGHHHSSRTPVGSAAAGTGNTHPGHLLHLPPSSTVPPHPHPYHDSSSSSRDLIHPQSSHLVRTSSGAIVDMRHHSPSSSSSSSRPEGLMMSHMSRGGSGQSMMDEGLDLSKKSGSSSSSGSRESPSSMRSLTPVTLHQQQQRKSDSHHRPITPTIPTPVGRSPYAPNYPLPMVQPSMPPPAHCNREALTPDYHATSRSSSVTNSSDRSPSVGPMMMGRRTPTGMNAPPPAGQAGIPPPLVSSAAMSPKSGQPIILPSGQMIPGMPPGTIPTALMYGHVRPGYDPMRQPVTTMYSKDIAQLQQQQAGMMKPTMSKMDVHTTSRSSSVPKSNDRSPSVGPMMMGSTSSSSRYPSMERRTPTGMIAPPPAGQAEIPPSLVSSAAMSPKSPKSGQPIHLPPEMPPGTIPAALMYGHVRPGYDPMRQPATTMSSKDIAQLQQQQAGMMKPTMSLMDVHNQSKTMFEHQQQLQHEMYRRSINSSPSTNSIRGPPGSAMMGIPHPPSGMAPGSADYRSFVERVHREQQQQKEREVQMMIDFTAAKQVSTPPSAHGQQQRPMIHEPPGGSLSAQLLADFNTSKQMRRENDGTPVDVVSRDGHHVSRKPGQPSHGMRSSISPAGNPGNRDSSPQVSRYTPYSVPPGSRSSPHAPDGGGHHRLPNPPTGPNYSPSIQGHGDNLVVPSSRSPHSPYGGNTGSPAVPAGRYTPSMSPGNRDTRAQVSPHGQVRVGDRMVQVSVPSSMYSPYGAITTSSASSFSTIGGGGHHALPPHVQASLIQAERERIHQAEMREGRIFPPGSQGVPGRYDSRSITPTTEQDQRLRQQQQPPNVIQSGGSSSWTPGMKQSPSGVIQSGKGGQIQNVPQLPPRTEYLQYPGHKKQAAYMMHHAQHVSSGQPQPGQQRSPAMGHGPPPPPGHVFARSTDAFQTLVDAAAAQQSLAVPGQSRSGHPPSDPHHRMVPTTGQQQGPGQMLFSALNFVGQKPPGQVPLSKDGHPGLPSRPGQHPAAILLDKRVMDANEVARDKIRQLFTAGEGSQPEMSHRGHPLDVRNMTSSSRPPPQESSYPPQPKMQPQIPTVGSRKGSPPGPPTSNTSTVLIPRPASIAGVATTSSEEAARLFSRSFEKDASGTKAPTAQGFTAANLIDAIITHQINNDRASGVPSGNGGLPTSASIGIPVPFSPSSIKLSGAPSSAIVTTSSVPTSNLQSMRQGPSPLARISPPSSKASPPLSTGQPNKILERRQSNESRDEDNSSPTDLVIDDSASDRPPSTKDDSEKPPSSVASSSSGCINVSSEGVKSPGMKENSRKRSSQDSEPISDRKSPGTSDVSAEKRIKEESPESGNPEVSTATTDTSGKIVLSPPSVTSPVEVSKLKTPEGKSLEEITISEPGKKEEEKVSEGKIN